MKVLFLDIDGVLNGIGTKEKCIEVQDGETRETGFTGISPRLVKILNRVIKETGAKVVLSTSWRIFWGVPGTKFNLEKAGFEGEIIGATPDMAGMHIGGWSTETAKRGHEIQAWLDKWAAEHPEDTVEKFAIVDDSSDMVHLTKRFVQTSFKHGIRPKNADRLIEMLR